MVSFIISPTSTLIFIDDDIARFDLGAIENIFNQLQKMCPTGMNVLAVFVIFLMLHRAENFIAQDLPNSQLRRLRASGVHD